MTVQECLAALEQLDRANAEVERRRTNPTPAERAERIAALRADYARHVLNDLMVATFKRLILTHVQLIKVPARPCWAALHSRVGASMPREPVWFRAHEGTYPCVHAGVLIGFCSREFATAFEALVTGGHLTVEIDLGDVDCRGVPSTTVRMPPSRIQ